MIYTLECTNTRETLELIDDNIYVVGRCHEADFAVADASFSRQQFRLAVESGRCVIEPISADNPTFLNGSRLTDKVALFGTSEIVAGSVCFVLSPSKQTGEPGVHNPTVVLERNSVTQHSSIPEEMAIESPSCILGRCAESADIALNHVSISLQHAEIFRKRKNYYVRDLGTTNGTFVDGHRIKSTPKRLTKGSTIEVGPFVIQFDGSKIRPLAGSRTAGLIAENLTRSLANKSSSGSARTLLTDISLCFLPGEFVAILGPSGSGKSTLLRALCNREMVELRSSAQGQIRFNGKDLYREFDRVKQLMAYIPQEDVLHEYLTIREALNFVAKLRLPRDSCLAEIDRRISEVLATVSLQPHLNQKIGKLSGGQKKRATLAAEILAEPDMFFLDEVTSGLDENTDREIMQLMGAIARQGKTIVCVTHNTANVLECCSLVVVLGSGGKLRFVGSPQEALISFEVERLAEIYDRVNAKDESVSLSTNQTTNDFSQTDHYRRYVTERITNSAVGLTKGKPQTSLTRDARFEAFLQQATTLIHRSLKLLVSDRSGLRSWVFQVLLIGILLIWVFGDVSDESGSIDGSQNRLGYFLVLSAFWFGCNNAARQIVREQSVFLHERDVGLSPTAFYLAKLIPLASAAFIQSACVMIATVLGCGFPGDLSQHLIVIAAVTTAGTSLGLCISSWSKSDEVAIGFVPIVLIPQILLANCIIELAGWAESVAQLTTTSYWGYEAETRILNVPLLETKTRFELIACVGVTLAQAIVFNAVGILGLLLKRR